MLISLLAAQAASGPDIAATGSTHASLVRDLHDSRLHSAQMGNYRFEGKLEAEKSEAALKAWLEHQSATELAAIIKTPAAADDVDIRAWNTHYNEAISRSSVRRWHKELAATHASPHTVWSTTATSAAFDKSGHFLPPQNVAYKPADAKFCCKRTCGLQNMNNKQVGGKRIDVTSCRTGCDLWLHHSSLNWESVEWRPKLMERCKRDCSSARAWDMRMKLNKYWKQFDPTLLPASPGSLYWVDHKDQLMPKLEADCGVGCENYLTCMTEANDAETPAEKAAFEAARVARVREAHGLWMKTLNMNWTSPSAAAAHTVVENVQAKDYHVLLNGGTPQEASEPTEQEAKAMAQREQELAEARLDDVKKVPLSQLSWSAKGAM
jgi:hypothetical protein